MKKTRSKPSVENDSGAEGSGSMEGYSIDGGADGKNRSTKNSFGRSATASVDPVELDTTDYRLISLLRENGRASSRDLARELGLTEATVRTRLRRMDASATMRVIAMTDFRAAGYQLMVSIGVQVKARSIADVAEDIAKLPQIFNVQIVIGTMDIELSGGAGNGEELAELMRTLWTIPGVYRLTPGMALEVIKFEWGAVPLL